MPEKDWAVFESILIRMHFDKHDFLLKEGQISKGLYFISAGAVRTYHLNDGKEISTAIRVLCG